MSHCLEAEISNAIHYMEQGPWTLLLSLLFSNYAEEVEAAARAPPPLQLALTSLDADEVVIILSSSLLSLLDRPWLLLFMLTLWGTFYCFVSDIQVNNACP